MQSATLPCLALQSEDSDQSGLVVAAYRKGSTLVNMLLIIMKDMVYLFVVVALLIFAFAGGCAAAFQMLLAVRIWAPFHDEHGRSLVTCFVGAKH